MKPSQALRAVLRGAGPLGVESRPLRECLGRVPVGPLRSPRDYPLRDVSAMDGFAYRFRDAVPGLALRLAGERMAGDGPGAGLKPGETMRIMTGAPLPPGADSVVAQERVLVQNGLVFPMEEPRKGLHVRLRGEGVKRGGRVALPPGPLTGRTLGFLASLGFGRLRLYRQPRVGVLVTGDELVEPGADPGDRGVFESNGLMLEAALGEMGLRAKAQRVGDRAARMESGLRRALKHCDVLVVTGGVSVGERDWTRKVLSGLGVREVFWRVDQKPGGPLYFGRKGRQFVFGLPGNPAAVYTCFHLYVRQLLQALRGLKALGPGKVRLSGKVRPLSRKTFFLKARREGDRARTLSGQGSHLLESLALGDGLLEVPPGPRVLPSGTKLDFHPFREVWA